MSNALQFTQLQFSPISDICPSLRSSFLKSCSFKCSKQNSFQCRAKPNVSRPSSNTHHFCRQNQKIGCHGNVLWGIEKLISDWLSTAIVLLNLNKKLSYRRGTAWCVVSIEILPIATQQCRNYLYDKSWPDRWYEVGDLVGALNHDAIESAAIVSSVINKPTTLSCVYHLSTDDLLWRNFLSPQCSNCSRDPDHAHIGSTYSSQD